MSWLQRLSRLFYAPTEAKSGYHALANIPLQGMPICEVRSIYSERERQAALGITYAVWMYAHAPCMKNPRHPTDEEIQQNAAHKAADRKTYDLSKGLLVNGKWTWPGVEDGCKCFSRSILPVALVR